MKVKKVAISNKKGVIVFALVDVIDYKKVTSHTWYLNGKYPSRKKTTNKKTYIIRMHHYILGVKREIDHIDGNPLNNTRSNLRLCTHQENSFNQKIPKNNTTGFKGVWFSKKNKKWTSTVRISGVRHYLGYFNDPILCAQAYDEKSKELFGEYARTNF